MRWLTYCVITTVQAIGDISVSLNARMSLTKDDNKQAMLDENRRLMKIAKENKIHNNFIVFLQNLDVQLENLVKEIKKHDEEQAKVPDEFTAGKYRLKPMKKLAAKPKKGKAIKEKTLEEFAKLTESGKDFKITEPFVIRNATALFKDWDGLRRQWTANRIREDQYLEKNLLIKYRAPDAPIYRYADGYRYWIPPNQITFSRYVTNCFLGSAAAPKIPGQATEHCEKTIDANNMVQKPEELENFNIFPGMKNVFSDFREWNQDFVEALENCNKTKKALGDRKDEFFEDNRNVEYRFFTFGPSGSGDKLHAENNLPFFDVLIHGMRRWLLLKEDEIEKVAAKAKEALEFRKTSAYMFFEEKLPELVEEFGLKNYVETNQMPGDVMVVPQGWYRVSLSLMDSISYYEQLLRSKEVISEYVNHKTWFPNYNTWRLGFCFEPDEVVEGTGGLGNPKGDKWLKDQFSNINDKGSISEATLEALIYCGRLSSSDDELAKAAMSGTKCDAKIWKACRKRFINTALEANKKATKDDFDFIPKKPPTPGAKKEGKDEKDEL